MYQDIYTLIVKTYIIDKGNINAYIDHHPAVLDWNIFIQWTLYFSCFDNETHIVKWMIAKII